MDNLVKQFDRQTMCWKPDLQVSVASCSRLFWLYILLVILLNLENAALLNSISHSIASFVWMD